MHRPFLQQHIPVLTESEWGVVVRAMRKMDTRAVETHLRDDSEIGTNNNKKNLLDYYQPVVNIEIVIDPST